MKTWNYKIYVINIFNENICEVHEWMCDNRLSYSFFVSKNTITEITINIKCKRKFIRYIIVFLVPNCFPKWTIYTIPVHIYPFLSKKIFSNFYLYIFTCFLLKEIIWENSLRSIWKCYVNMRKDSRIEIVKVVESNFTN